MGCGLLKRALSWKALKQVWLAGQSGHHFGGQVSLCTESLRESKAIDSAVPFIVTFPKETST